MKICLEAKLEFTSNQDRQIVIDAMKCYSALVRYGIKCLKPQNEEKKQTYKTLTEKFSSLPARTISLAVEQDISATLNSFAGLEAKNYPLTMRFDKDNAEFYIDQEDNKVKVKLAIDRPQKGTLTWITATVMPKRSLTYKYYKILFTTAKGYHLPFKLVMRNGQIYAKITVEKETLLSTNSKPVVYVGIDLNAFWVGKKAGHPLAVAFLKEDGSFARQPLLMHEWAQIPQIIRQTQREGKIKTKKAVTNQIGIMIKKLLTYTKDYQPIFKLEKLHGLNKLKGGYSKFFYAKLLDMLETKSLHVQLVNPAYTSQTCSRCGKLGKVSHRVFTCPTCYPKGIHRDINAAINIAILNK